MATWEYLILHGRRDEFGRYNWRGLQLGSASASDALAAAGAEGWELVDVSWWLGRTKEEGSGVEYTFKRPPS